MFVPIGRFPAIEQDESPRYLLLTDCPRYYQPGWQVLLSARRGRERK